MTYAGHERLFSPGRHRQGARARGADRRPEAAPGSRVPARLSEHGIPLGRATASLSDKAATLEAEATFQGPDGVEHPFRGWSA